MALRRSFFFSTFALILLVVLFIQLSHLRGRQEPLLLQSTNLDSSDQKLPLHTSTVDEDLVETSSQYVDLDQKQKSRPDGISPYQNFPHKIWQTARTRTNLGSEPDVGTWLEKNPGHRYERITQRNDREYVREKYADRPEIADTFTQLEDGMLRADLVQYLFLLEEGGVYTDLDTTCLKPIDEWIPKGFEGADIDFVIGIEGDSRGEGIISGFTYEVQFATWTMMVKPRNAIMSLIVDRVIAQVQALADKQGVPISELKATYMDVMDTTGPGIWTKTIWQGMSEATGEDIDWHMFRELKEPKLVGSTLVLPITSFGAGLPHSGAGPMSDPTALVWHHFAGSWKGDHPMSYGNGQTDAASSTSPLSSHEGSTPSSPGSSSAHLNTSSSGAPSGSLADKAGPGMLDTTNSMMPGSGPPPSLVVPDGIPSSAGAANPLMPDGNPQSISQSPMQNIPPSADVASLSQPIIMENSLPNTIPFQQKSTDAQTAEKASQRFSKSQ